MPSETSPLLSEDTIDRPPLLTQVTTGTNGTFKAPIDAESQSLISETSTEEDGGEEEKPDVNVWMILPAIAIGIMLSAMDNTIVVSSYGRIGSDLKELNRTSWIATS